MNGKEKLRKVNEVEITIKSTPNLKNDLIVFLKKMTSYMFLKLFIKSLILKKNI